MSDEELAQALGISVAELHGLRAQDLQTPATPDPPFQPVDPPSQDPLASLRAADLSDPMLERPMTSREPAVAPMVSEQRPDPIQTSNAATALQGDVDVTMGLQETQPPADELVRLEGTPAGGIVSVRIGSDDPAAGRASRVVSGTPAQIEAQLQQLEFDGIITPTTRQRALATIPLVGGGRPGGVPMATVQTTLEQQLRGQATPEMAAELGDATAARRAAQHGVDTAQQARYDMRQAGLGQVADVQQQQALEAQQQAEAQQRVLRDRMRRYDETLARVSEMRIDPTQFWGSSGGERFTRGLGAAIAVALSGLGQAFGGGENGALQQINLAVERNIAAQRDNLANARAGAAAQGQALQQMRAIFQDETAAAAATRALHLQAVISRVQQLENGAAGEYAARLAKLRDMLERERLAAQQIAAATAVQATVRTQTTQRVPAGALSGPQAALQTLRGQRDRAGAGRAPGGVQRPVAGAPTGVSAEELEAMQERAQATQTRQGRPGIRIVRADLWPTEAAEMRRANELSDAALGIRRFVPRLVGLRRQQGTEWFRSRGAQEMRASAEVLRNILRIAQGMQAPQAAELERLDQQIPDPTDVGGLSRLFAGDDPLINQYLGELSAFGQWLTLQLEGYGAQPEGLDVALSMIQTPQRPARQTLGQRAGAAVDRVAGALGIGEE